MSDSIYKITREALYEEVWTDPVTTVAFRYGLSDVGLAKVCRKLLIPLPSRDYWAMVKAGRVMKKAKLPKLKSSQEVIVPIERISDQLIADKKDAKAKAKNQRKLIGATPVQTELSNPHPLVRQALRRLKSKNCPVDEKGLCSDPAEILNLVVSKDSVDRALLLTDSLIKALELQGAAVTLDKNQTLITVKTTSIQFAIREHVSRSKRENLDQPKPKPKTKTKSRNGLWEPNWDAFDYFSPYVYEYTPTGKLTIAVGGYTNRNWNDTASTRLESRMAYIVSGIFELIEEIRLNKEAERRKEEAKLRARENYKFTVDLYNKEMDRYKKLEENADNFEKAQRLRRYADALEQRAIVTPGGCTPETKEWLIWARAKADWIDPFIQVSDIILDRPKPINPDRHR